MLHTCGHSTKLRAVVATGCSCRGWCVASLLKFEREMVRQVESGVGAERERVRELVERVVAMSEVEFPGEERVREVLGRDRDLT